VLLPYALVIFDRLVGSKHIQYLRIQSTDEYVSFSYAGYWRESEGRESENF
jgi:hypothetical protein